MKKTIIFTAAVSILSGILLANSADAADGVTVRKIVNLSSAPGGIGSYSQAVIAGNTMYVSAQMGLEPKTMEFISDNAGAQMDQALKNLGAILSAGVSNYNKVVRATIFITDLNSYREVASVYKRYFTEKQPALSVVQVSGLARGALVQVEATAIVGEIKDE